MYASGLDRAAATTLATRAYALTSRWLLAGAPTAVVQQALLFATGIAVARLLGPEPKAMLAAAIAIGGLSGGLAALGLEFTAARALADGSAAAGYGRVFAVRLGLAFGVAPIVALVLTSAIVPGDLSAMAIGVSLSLASVARTAPLAVLRASGNAGWIAAGRLLQLVTYALGVALCVLLAMPSLAAVGLVYAGSIAVATAMLASRAWPNAGAMATGGPGTRGGLRADLSAGARHTAAAFAAGDLAMLDILLFGFLVGPAAMGSYAACRAFVNVGYFAAQTTSPALAARPTPPGISWPTLAVAIAACAGAWFAAPVLLGPAFEGAALTGAILGLAGAAYGHRLQQSEWRRMHGRGRLPVETLGIPVLLGAGVIGGSPALLALVFTVGQVVQLAALAAVNQRTRVAWTS